jgi:hypothetical protein
MTLHVTQCFHPKCQFFLLGQTPPTAPTFYYVTPLWYITQKQTTSPTRHSDNVRWTAYGKYQSLPRQYQSRAPCGHHNPKPSHIRTFDYVLFYLDHRTMGRLMRKASARGSNSFHPITEKIYTCVYIYISGLHKENSTRVGGGAGGSRRKWQNAPHPRNTCGFCWNNSTTKHEGCYTRKLTHTNSWWCSTIQTYRKTDTPVLPVYCLKSVDKMTYIGAAN